MKEIYNTLDELPDAPLSAFPYVINHKKETHFSAGMDLRDYFAAKAMPLVMEMWNNHIKNNPDQGWSTPTTEMADFDLIAYDSYMFANAMLVAREDIGLIEELKKLLDK